MKRISPSSVNFVGRGRSQRGWCPLDRLPLRQYIVSGGQLASLFSMKRISPSSVNFVGRGRSQRGWCPLDRLPLRQYSEWGSTGEPFFYETYFPEQREFFLRGTGAWHS